MAENDAPNDNTFDLDSPRRPGDVDFNGIEKINAGTGRVSDPRTMPSAEEYNTICALLVALGKVCPIAVALIDGGTTPVCTTVLAPGSNIVASGMICTRVSAGYIRVKWLAATEGGLPAMNLASASVYEDVSNPTIECHPWAGAGAGYQGVEIKTWVGGVATDVNVVLSVY